MNEVELLESLREEYKDKRSIFVRGEDMKPLLRYLGALESDMRELERVGDDLAPDPTLPFRQTRSGRFSFEFYHRRIRRLEPQPFILTAAEDFIRHDSGQLRKFDDIDSFQSNSVLTALLRFNAFIVDGIDVRKRPGLDYTNATSVCTVFAIRTITSPDRVGEPALEGVHTDGVDHTMTTFLAAHNLTQDSGRTYMHDMREKSGIRWDDAAPKYRIGSVRHTHFLDTLVVVDNERKHSVTPVIAATPDAIATRDMMIFFTRKPAETGHVSYEYDAITGHTSDPLSFDMVSL